MPLDLERDRDVLQLLRTIAAEATSSHWNALLTYNGILIAVFSIFAVFGKINHCLLLILPSCFVISSGLLIWSFASAVDSSQKMLTRALGLRPPATDEEKEKQNKALIWRFRRVTIAQALILLQTVLLFLFIYLL
ncbi:MAG: hypothetical protein WBW16_00565 [Bacteroidota bacterium]